MEKKMYDVKGFIMQLNNMLIGKKLSLATRVADMPILWFGHIEEEEDNLIPGKTRKIAECEVHVECPFVLKHVGHPIIGSYDVYLDEKGNRVDLEKSGMKTLFNVRAEQIPALELIVQDISYHPVLGLTIHFQDQYSLTLNHDSRLMTDFWCLKEKDQKFIFINNDLKFDCAATKPIESLEPAGNDHPSAGEFQKLEGKELKRIKLFENGDLILFLGDDIPWMNEQGQKRKTTCYTLRIFMPFRMLDQNGILWGSRDYLYYNSEYTLDERFKGGELDQMTRVFVEKNRICVRTITVTKANEIRIYFSNGTVFQTLPHSSSPDLMWWELRDNGSSKRYD